jgi:cytochrome c peroxidase
MHDGSLKTLEDVLDHYVAGGRTRNPNKDPMLQPLALSPQNRLDMIAFLESLTDTELLHDIRFSDPW